MPSAQLFWAGSLHPFTWRSCCIAILPDDAELRAVAHGPAGNCSDRVIASQAVITGAYSVARQAVQLNILPRLEIQHTSESCTARFIFRASICFRLAVVILRWFEKSSNLAAAYGIAVTGNMLVTTVLLYIVMTRIWNWRVALRPS